MTVERWLEGLNFNLKNIQYVNHKKGRPHIGLGVFFIIVARILHIKEGWKRMLQIISTIKDDL